MFVLKWRASNACSWVLCSRLMWFMCSIVVLDVASVISNHWLQTALFCLRWRFRVVDDDKPWTTTAPRHSRDGASGALLSHDDRLPTWPCQSRAHVPLVPFYRFLNILCRIPRSVFAGPLQLTADVWNDVVLLPRCVILFASLAPLPRIWRSQLFPPFRNQLRFCLTGCSQLKE